jgi:aryl-alcohol dehydrogenase-like predicted oxidoreductase
MQKRRLGRTGLEVSVLGYGAGAVGGLFTKGAAADQERAVVRALEAGINYFDTAALYGNGESERNLGRVLKALKADVIVGTKVRLGAEHRAHVGKAIEQGMDDSLKRMGRDHVDLFQLHNPLVAQDSGDKLAIDIALNEVAPALEKLRKAGKTRFIGFSGVGETAALHRAIDSKLFDTIQVVYNALNPSAGGALPKGTPGQDYGRLFDKVKAADMGTIIIRALAGGALAGTEQRHPLAMQVVDPIGSAPSFAGDVARAKEFQPLVREGVAGSLTELAQRFVIAHPVVSTMLVGYSTLDQLEAAIAAVNKGPLPDAALKRITSDAPGSA